MAVAAHKTASCFRNSNVRVNTGPRRLLSKDTSIEFVSAGEICNVMIIERLP